MMRQQGEIDLIGAALTWPVFFGACFPPRATATLLPTCCQQYHQSRPNWLLAVRLGGKMSISEWSYGWRIFVIVSEVLACLCNLIPRGWKDARGGPEPPCFAGWRGGPTRTAARSFLPPAGWSRRSPGHGANRPGRMRVRGRSAFTHVAENKKRVA